MSRIKVSDVRLDKRVSNVLMAYTNSDFIAGQMMPTIPNLTERTGKIPVLGTNHLRIYDSRRATYDRGRHEMEFTISTDLSYSIDDYDLETYLPDKLLQEQQSPFNLRRDAGMSLLQSMMLERENALATLFTSTAAITNNTTLSGTDQWNDYANSNPDTDVETGRNTIFNAIGREANAMYMSRGVFNKLKYHPLFLNRVSGVKVLSPAVLVNLIKELWEIEYLYIGKSIKVTSNEGQTVTKAKVWQDDCVLFYRAPRPSIYEPSFGYSFMIKGKNMKASNRREPNADKGTLERLEWSYQDKILDTNAIYLIKSAIA